MLPNGEAKTNVHSWDEFKAKKAAQESVADLGAKLVESIKQADAAKAAPPATPRPKRRPNTVVEATLGEVLRHAVQIAMTRKRGSREDAVREQVLLDVLTDAMRRVDV